jgi:hypothetical protein
MNRKLVYEIRKDKDMYDVVLNITEIRRRIFNCCFYKVRNVGMVRIMPLHYEIHQTMLQLNEAPLFLLMNPNPMPSLKQLPIRLSESQVHIMHNDCPTFVFVFVDLPFTLVLVTSPMEQISIDGLTIVTSSVIRWRFIH